MEHGNRRESRTLTTAWSLCRCPHLLIVNIVVIIMTVTALDNVSGVLYSWTGSIFRVRVWIRMEYFPMCVCVFDQVLCACVSSTYFFLMKVTHLCFFE